jgi:ABC-type antimicrobial peptide transport system permease subunit
VSGRLFTVVGIAPPGFAGPAAGMAPEFWVPLSAASLIENDFLSDEAGLDRSGRGSHTLMLFGRLAGGTTREAANRDLAGLAARMAEAHPDVNRDYTMVASPMQRLGFSTNPGDETPMVSLSAVLVGMSAVVLTVACLNLANMLLARGTSRRKEIAVRLSLGSSRLAIVRQLLAEGFLLSLAGGAAGLTAGYWAMVLLVRSIAPLLPIPFEFDVSLDWRVVAAMQASAPVATILFALGPALRATRPDVIEGLKEQADEDRGRCDGSHFSAAAARAASYCALHSPGQSRTPSRR